MDAMEEITFGNDMPTIPEFFKGRSIFVTGATGFMGKVNFGRISGYFKHATA